jgi:hypothetical protein
VSDAVLVAGGRHPDGSGKGEQMQQRTLVAEWRQASDQTISDRLLRRLPNDSDYNGDSFWVRQAYLLGQNDQDKSLKTSLKAESDHAGLQGGTESGAAGSRNLNGQPYYRRCWGS